MSRLTVFSPEAFMYSTLNPISW